MDAGAVGVVFLAPASGLAQAANVLTKAGAYIHAELKTRLSPINLQTISDIEVDFTVIGRLVSLMIDTVPFMLLPSIGATEVQLPLRRLA